MTIEELNKNIRKRQRSLLRQIATREQKIAALRHEQDQLRNELLHVSDTQACRWASGEAS